MSPGLAGRAFTLLLMAGIGGLPIIPAMGGCLLSAEAQEAGEPATPLPATAGNPPGGAFFIDLREGFHPKTQYISNFDIDNEHLLEVLRSENVVFSPAGMSLFARRSDEEGKPYTVGEFMQRGFYGYGRYETVMRASDAVGVVSSFFTHTSSMFGDPHMEVDFEIVGRKPREMHLNYFAGGKDDPENVRLWFDASKGEHLYAFEWMPDSITWYVDRVKVREVTTRTSPVGIPANSGRVIASILTGARSTLEWLGTPDFDRAEAFYSCVSHVPIGQTGRQCSDTFTPPAQ